MEKIIAVVLSYHPSQDIVENIRLLMDQAAHVVIVDNESTSLSQKILRRIAGARVTIIENRNNNGVATGFNQGIKWGLENNFHYFLLMDQDSQIVSGMVSLLVQTLIEFENPLTLVGPFHQDVKKPQKFFLKERFVKWPLLITSGTLLSKTIIDKIGLYDDALFIDHVDHDYCLRLAKFGGQCIIVNSAVLNHKFGSAQIHTLLGKSFFIQDYSPFRRFHMMRNRIVLYKRYGMFSGAWFWIDLRSAFKDFAKLLFFEANKGPKLRAIARGLWDGILWIEK